MSQSTPKVTVYTPFHFSFKVPFRELRIYLAKTLKDNKKGIISYLLFIRQKISVVNRTGHFIQGG